jgi:TRAP-type C4-dicarboxylate transport system permease small subunit
MTLRRILHALYDGAALLAAAFIFAIFAIMIGASVMRQLGMRTGGTDDLVAWFCAAAAFLAMAHTFRHGDFVRVMLLLEKVDERWRRALEITSLAVAAVFCGYLAWAAMYFVYESWDFHDMAGGMIAIPLWIPQSSFVVGTLLLLTAVIEELVVLLRGGKPSYVIAVEERHARGDFSEDI